jgi:hypothetical protein
MSIKCPFCSYNNEDGALFCEQCKSDLSAVPVEAGIGVETMPIAGVVEAAPIFAEPAMLEAAPVMEAAPAPAPAPAAGPAVKIAADAKPRLVVLRGLKINVEYPIYEGNNFIGRADEKPVDIDLDDQEPPDRVWSSRQHALIVYENSELLLEDLNSANGTFVNRTRVYPGQKRPIAPNDVIQIGTVQLKLKV